MTELEKAKLDYPTASAETKKVLENIFGRAAFEPKITDRVKTFEDACEVLGIKPSDAVITALPESMNPFKIAMQAHTKLMIIAAALNQGWQPNWLDSNEYKYYPWLKAEKRAKTAAGFGFSCANCDHGYSLTSVGSRLCFKTRELAEYAGTQFEELYNEYFIIAK